MQTGAITQYIDVAQLVLYAFWIFFAGLVYYLHRENKREGYPLENDRSGAVRVQGFPAVPDPKTYRLRDGRVVTTPRGPEVAAVALRGRPSGPWLGAPLLPDGGAGMGSGIGPGGYANRADIPDATADGQARIVPLRVTPGLGVVSKDPDARGMPVVGGDGLVAGRVADLWVDRAEMLFRYLEVELAGGAQRVLVPMGFARIGRGRVRVRSILSTQFAGVPPTRSPETLTLLEEERIMAYYGAGTLYATPARSEPFL